MTFKFIYIILMCLLASLISSLTDVPFYKIFLCQMLAVGIIVVSQSQKEDQMAADLQTISKWYDRGKSENYRYMIVVCDTFDYSDYPIYTTEANYSQEYSRASSQGRIMEVYDLAGDKLKQLREPFANSVPK